VTGEASTREPNAARAVGRRTATAASTSLDGATRPTESVEHGRPALGIQPLMSTRWDRFVQDFDRSTSRKQAPAPSDHDTTRARLERLGRLLLEAGRRGGEFWDRLDDDERKELGAHVGDLVKRPREGTRKSSEEWQRLMVIVRKGLGLDAKEADPGDAGTRPKQLPPPGSKRSRRA
jgi:hypothetical protein